jgi:hypothetical protein
LHYLYPVKKGKAAKEAPKEEAKKDEKINSRFKSNKESSIVLPSDTTK